MSRCMTLDCSFHLVYNVQMKYFIQLTLVAIVCILSMHSAYAVTLNKELAYRVRFSKQGDVNLLLDKGANPNAINETGLPMVSVAASRKDEDAVPVLRTLVEHGADVNKGGQNNQYPIIIAAREDNTDMIKYLLDETNVNVTVRDLNGLLPMEIAEYYGSKHVAQLLKESTEKRLEAERERVSPKRRDELVKQLAYSYCEHDYMSYYYKSGQSGLPKQDIRSHIEAYRLKAKALIDELYMTFGVPVEQALDMKEEIGTPLRAELDAMISNRERARHGVGTKEDLAKRCDRYAGDWLKKYEKDQRKKDEMEEWK